MIAAMRNIGESLSQLFFPHVCAGCGSDILGRQQLLCLHCMAKMPLTHFEKHAGNPVEKIFWGRLPLTSACSYFYFTKSSMLQQLLHQLKYKGKKEIGWYLGEQMGKALATSDRFSELDALIPLPLFPKRERMRGYNQANIICQGMAAQMGIPVYTNALRRMAYTETQTHKSRIERWHNMEGRFECPEKTSLRNKHVLLVDDVVTTGATLEAAGQALLEIAGLRLSIASVAYTST